MTVNGVFLGTTGENGTRQYQMVFDMRSKIAEPFASKELLERAQLEKYRLDYLLHFGFVPFEAVERGGEPPDFIVKRTGGEWRIDCAALALQSRRLAESLFSRLIRRLAQGGSAWRNLAGCDVLISFNSPGHLPPAKNDISIDEEIETALTSMVVDHERLAQLSKKIAAEGFPKQWPSDVKIATIKHDSFFIVANPLPAWCPRNQFETSLGFRRSLQYPIVLKEITSEIMRMVSQHDNSATQHLILSIGGPNLEGFSYPAESLLEKILEDSPIQLVEAHYLEQVTAHVWNTGKLIEISVARPG
jgi:hypothetical protein